jgi:hypothetical protein
MKQKKLKITAEWTEDVYYSRRNEHTDDLDKVEVNGWLVRINGKKYPRGHTDGDGSPDWTYRWTPEEGHTEEGKRIAIWRAMQSARLPMALLKESI